LTSGLDGITRRTIITLAAEMGLAVKARRITRDDVYCADEAFFTGTAAEVMPIVELDRRRIAQGKPGPIALELQRRFFACVKGEDAGHAEWLTHIA
jgi:branched-chain amino acid aminotransferase